VNIPRKSFGRIKKQIKNCHLQIGDHEMCTTRALVLLHMDCNMMKERGKKKQEKQEANKIKFKRIREP
jgi:hypothetical protein